MSSRAGLRSVKVQVAGQTLALRTDASSKYLRELAALVDARLAEVRDRHASAAATDAGPPRRPVSTQALALLCALQLADELRQVEQRERALRRTARERTARILAHLDHLDPQGRSPEPPRGAGARRRARAVASWR
jgi:cell division protein ZapA (FtsZ GTPase activity inhibitor)